MAEQVKFSVIIPTYTGEEHIEKTFSSLLTQKGAGRTEYEVIVVIDGPNDSLRAVVDVTAEKFRDRDIRFLVHQFKKNQGRFAARMKGAELARYDQLLFVDDRITLDTGFLKNVLAAKTDILMPNVLEASQPNELSRVNYLLRRRIYGKKMWGADFKSYEIDAGNFERSPKGTTSLWVPKKVFTRVCEQVARESKGKNGKYVNDDTRLLRLVIEYGHPIFRSSQARIFYNPRSRFADEASHLYNRGPAFVDYYAKKGSRFRPVIYAGLTGLLLAAAGIVVFGAAFLIALAAALAVCLLLTSIYVAETPRDILDCLWVLPLALLLFGLGTLNGLLIKVLNR